MSEPVFVSASQVETFNQCARKWGFDKIDKLERAEHAGAIESSKLHEECENFHREGAPASSSAARTALRLAPPPGPWVVVEQGFEWPMPDSNIVFTGFIDLLDLTDPKHPRIWDYKFYRDLKYAKDAEDLRNDLQRIVYTHIIFEEFPEAHTVSFGLIQVSKRGKHDSKTVAYPSDRHMAREHFNKASSLAWAIAGHRELTSRAIDIEPPPNDTPCSAYGGCPYLAHCPDRPEPTRLSPEEFVLSLTFNEPEDPNDMSFLKNVKKPAAAPTAPVAAAPTPKPAIPAAKPVAAPPPVAAPKVALKRFVAPTPPPPPEPEVVEEEVVEEQVEEAAEEVVETTAEEVVGTIPQVVEGAIAKRGGRKPGSKDKTPRNTASRKQTLLLMEIRDLLKHGLVQAQMLEEGTDTAADPSELAEEDEG